VLYVISNIDGVDSIKSFRVENHPDGITIDMGLVLIYGFVIKPLLRQVQKKVADEIERLTALNINSINITAVSLEKR